MTLEHETYLGNSRKVDLPFPFSLLYPRFERLIQTNVQGRENLVAAQKHLEGRGSVLATMNHLGLLDPVIYLFTMEPYIPSNSAKAALASSKYKEGKMGKASRLSEVLFSRSFGYELLPVVQHYMKKELKDSGQKEKAYGQNYSSLARAIEILSSPGGVLLVAPEGTRSRTKEMQQAVPAVGRVFGMARNRAAVLPIAIWGTEKLPMDLEKFNPVHHFKLVKWLFSDSPFRVVVGKPLTYDETAAEARRLGVSVADVMMVKIGEMLPKRYWGHYGQHLARVREA